MTEEFEFDARSSVSDLLDIIESQSRQLEYLNILYLKMKMNLEKIIKLEQQDRKRWHHLLPRIKEMVENHDGLQGYVSANLSPELKTLSSKVNKYLSTNKVDKHDKLTIK